MIQVKEILLMTGYYIDEHNTFHYILSEFKSRKCWLVVIYLFFLIPLSKLC